MEKRANYALIGLFTLLVVASAFGFVFWFQNQGTKKTRIAYRIVFEGPTVGLRVGANVNFNGIRIGEVDSVKIDDPQHVVALVSVERKAPVRKDTTVGLEFQGLTGIAAVALKGGSVNAPEVEPDADGILTLVPVAHLEAATYDYDKKVASLAVKGLKGPLTGSLEYRGVNALGIGGRDKSPITAWTAASTEFTSGQLTIFPS